MPKANRLCFPLIVLSSLSSPTLGGELPDTGQTSCYGASSGTYCEDAGYPRQDGSLVAPLAYTKFDAAGNTLYQSATTWACVRDDVTGLVWEAKTSDGLQGVAHRYAWANVDTTRNGGDAGGTTETAWCAETLNTQACTTENYTAAINGLNLCGASDWRLPTQRELLTLMHSGVTMPTIASAFFPNTAADVYWAATTYAPIPALAWGVNFAYGAANADYKNRPYRVRLVRGTPF